MQKLAGSQKQELGAAVLLFALLTAFISPPGLLMPESSEMFLLVVFIVVFLAYMAVVWNESARDEREHVHQLMAGRISFFVGTSALTIGIIVQTMHHNIDPWLVAALGVMILTKIVVRMYTQYAR